VNPTEAEQRAVNYLCKHGIDTDVRLPRLDSFKCPECGRVADFVATRDGKRYPIVIDGEKARLCHGDLFK